LPTLFDGVTEEVSMGLLLVQKSKKGETRSFFCIGEGASKGSGTAAAKLAKVFLQPIAGTMERVLERGPGGLTGGTS